MKPLTTSASDRTNLLAWALAYARAGWPVFPLRERGKEPITPNGYKQATTDHDIIIAWWSQFPNANLGIQTGIEFDVLDIDGPEGKTALLNYLKHVGIGTDRPDPTPPYIHAGPVSLTGKGIHLLFKPTEAGNRAGLVDHVDFRGLGGYIVGPPSIHPLGHRYRWDDNRPPTTTLPEYPDWLKLLLVRAPRQPITDTGVRVKLPNKPVQARLSTAGQIAETRPDIIAVAHDLGLDPRPSGRYHVVSCPFHDDSTPSMTLYVAPQDTFYCHGCGAHGDSLDLMQKRDMEGRAFI
jgi:hypothetical protein